MPAQPLHCRLCQGVFYPPVSQPGAAVQCPHCSSQMLVGDCEPADAPAGASGQEYIRVTEEQEAAQRGDLYHGRWTRRILIAAGAAVALGAGIYLWQGSSRDQTAGREAQKLETLVREEKLSREEEQELTAMAARLMEARKWQDWLPEVANAEKVEASMRWYYGLAGKTLEPDRLVALGDIQRSNAGRETLRLQVTTARVASMWLPLLRESGRWKLDWEAWSGADTERWAAFLREPAGTSIEVRLQAALKPGAESYLVKARVPASGFKALHLWSFERAALAAAVLADKDPLWREMKDIDFNNAAKFIGRVTMVAPEMSPPLVRLEEVVQQGWVRP